MLVGLCVLFVCLLRDVGMLLVFKTVTAVRPGGRRTDDGRRMTEDG